MLPLRQVLIYLHLGFPVSFGGMAILSAGIMVGFPKKGKG